MPELSTRIAGKSFDIASACTLMICAVWIFGALMQLQDLRYLRNTVRSHGVLSDRWTDVVVAVPIIELVLGAGIGLVAGNRRVGRAGTIPLVLSCCVLLIFSAYLMLVPAPTLQSSGCACHGALVTQLVGGLPGTARAWYLAINGAFIALHIPVLQSEWRTSPN